MSPQTIDEHPDKFFCCSKAIVFFFANILSLIFVFKADRQHAFLSPEPSPAYNRTTDSHQHTHTYTHTYIHTHIHIYIHTHTTRRCRLIQNSRDLNALELNRQQLERVSFRMSTPLHFATPSFSSSVLLLDHYFRVRFIGFQ